MAESCGGPPLVVPVTFGGGGKKRWPFGIPYPSFRIEDINGVVAGVDAFDPDGSPSFTVLPCRAKLERVLRGTDYGRWLGPRKPVMPRSLRSNAVVLRADEVPMFMLAFLEWFQGRESGSFPGFLKKVTGNKSPYLFVRNNSATGMTPIPVVPRRMPVSVHAFMLHYMIEEISRVLREGEVPGDGEMKRFEWFVNQPSVGVQWVAELIDGHIVHRRPLWEYIGAHRDATALRLLLRSRVSRDWVYQGHSGHPYSMAAWVVADNVDAPPAGPYRADVGRFENDVRTGAKREYATLALLHGARLPLDGMFDGIGSRRLQPDMDDKGKVVMCFRQYVDAYLHVNKTWRPLNTGLDQSLDVCMQTLRAILEALILRARWDDVPVSVAKAAEAAQQAVTAVERGKLIRRIPREHPGPNIGHGKNSPWAKIMGFIGPT